MKIELSSSELDLLHVVIESVRYLLKEEKKKLDVVTFVGMSELCQSRTTHLENLALQISALDALYSKLSKLTTPTGPMIFFEPVNASAAIDLSKDVALLDGIGLLAHGQGHETPTPAGPAGATPVGRLVAGAMDGAHDEAPVGVERDDRLGDHSGSKILALGVDVAPRPRDQRKGARRLSGPRPPDLRPVAQRMIDVDRIAQHQPVQPVPLHHLAPRGQLIAAMQRGGSSADCWVLTEGEVDHTSLLQSAPSTMALAHQTRPVTSRAAENLFWLGRYTERAENSIRLAQIVLNHVGGEEPSSRPLMAWLSATAHENSLVLPGVPAAEQSTRVFARSLMAGLSPVPGTPLAEQSYSVGFNLRALKASAAQVRERLSQEHWNLIVRVEAGFARDGAALSLDADYTSAEALAALQNASELQLVPLSVVSRKHEQR